MTDRKLKTHSAETLNPRARGVSRRQFIATTAATGAGLTIVPRHVLGGPGMTPPSDLLNIAGVGVGGMGRSNLLAVASENIVAGCDVDWDFAEEGFQRAVAQVGREASQPPRDDLTAEQQRERAGRAEAMRRVREVHLPRLQRYTDYREMLEKQKDIDAVIIATPDHTHAVIASAAMDLGKHVYVQKPLTWSIEEARALAKKAAETNVATQMGNQGHSSNDARLVNEYIWADAIGEVRELHVWTNRPLAYWPQGVPRPEALTSAPGELRWNMDGVMARLADAMAGSYPAPHGLAWDLFLGPAPEIDYHPLYHPFNWRGWVDWGVGAIGDMGAHLIDHPMWALDLSYPTSVETVSTPFNGACYPMSTTSYFEFPARGDLPPVKLTWYDGGLTPPKPEEFGDDEALMGEGGVLYVGSKGKLLHGTYARNPRLLPQSLHDSVGTPPEKLPRIEVSHEMNWVEAAKGQAEATCPFDYAARLTEVMLLGVVALRAGTKIHYDGEQMRVTNAPEANQFLGREYRKGWSLS